MRIGHLGGLFVILTAILLANGSFFAADSADAGSTTPNATPAPTSYTLEDIYTRLTSNAAATEANHDLNPNMSPGATMYSLGEIYDAIPVIDAATVLFGTSYMGIDGSFSVDNLTNEVIKLGTAWGEDEGETGILTPDGGTATVSDMFNGKTAHVTGDWNLDTGTLDLACNVSTFNGTANLVATSYDGGGNGTNRWCMTESGDAAATDVLTGSTAWVDGVEVSGSMANVGTQTITPTTSNIAITEGYHNGTGYCAGDSDLIAGNVKNGVDLFGVTGTFAPTVDLPACSFTGTIGDVYAKNSNCTWTDRCQIGTDCTDTCTVTVVTHAVATTASSDTSCYITSTLIGETCDVCIVTLE